MEGQETAPSRSICKVSIGCRNCCKNSSIHRPDQSLTPWPKPAFRKGVIPMLLSEPFRVGFVLKRYPRYSETFVVREILAHEEAGLSAELPGLVARLEEIPEAESRDVYQGLQLARAVRRKNIQHLHAPFASDAATVARLASHFSGVPYSFTARAKDIFHEDVEPEYLRRKLRDAVGVVTIIDFQLDYLRKSHVPLADKVQRIYNGLSLEEFPF